MWFVFFEGGETWQHKRSSLPNIADAGEKRAQGGSGRQVLDYTTFSKNNESNFTSIKN